MEQTSLPKEESSLLYVQDVDQFAAIVASWWKQKQKELEHMLQVPEGTPVIIGAEENEHILSGDVHTGFLLGISTALIAMGNLPFDAQEIPDQANG